jgi:ADP-ribose pyrophosphatase YjhB (NUDIX family)
MDAATGRSPHPFQIMNTKSFCHFCGHPLLRKPIEGRQRLFCNHCERIIYENPIPATCVIVHDGNRHLVLVKRNVPPKKGWWCLPGGFIELGEEPRAGAIRELVEETGLIAENASLIGVCATPSPQYHSVLMISYSVEKFSGLLTAGDDAAQAEWFSFSKLPPIAFDSHIFFIHQYCSGRSHGKAYS